MNRRQMIITSAGVLAVTATGCASTAAPGGPAPTPGPVLVGNVLADPWSGPYQGVPPWDQVTVDLLRDALNRGIDVQRAEVAAIVGNSEPATFDYTLLALERSGEHLVLFGCLLCLF